MTSCAGIKWATDRTVAHLMTSCSINWAIVVLASCAVLERLWAGWRLQYIEGAEIDADGGCVFCAILDSGLPDERTYIVSRTERSFIILNAYPYTSGHLMVMPLRHVPDLSALDADERVDLWETVHRAIEAMNGAYTPEGINMGANLGRAAGAGVPGHVHVHVVPRWAGDTNFMTAIAETRVMPESLDQTWRRLRAQVTP